MQPGSGFVLENAHIGEQVPVLCRGLLESDRDPKISAILDSFFTSPLGDALRSKGIQPSFTDNLLYHQNNKDEANVWVNLKVIADALPKRSAEAGQPVTADDLADIRSVEFENVGMPVDGHVLVLFQHRWRRYLYFDFTAPPEELSRPLEGLQNVITTLFLRAFLPERAAFDDDGLKHLADHGWFPFARLPTKWLTFFAEDAAKGRDPGRTGDAILDWLTPARMRDICATWNAKAAFAAQMPFVASFVDLYEEERWIPAISTLLPRLEGTIRAAAKLDQGVKKLTQGVLDAFRAKMQAQSALVPEGFFAYLQMCHDVPFSINDAQRWGRHSVAHGVLEASAFTRARAAQLFLSLDHLFFLI